MAIILASATTTVYAETSTNGNFVAHLSASPGLDTRATGEAIFHLSADGTVLHYKLIVANINNVFMAHIHLHSTHQIVVWLSPTVTPDPICLSNAVACEIPGRFDGVLIQGEITSADFTGALAGMPLTALIALFQAGSTFVNVHTIQHPGGEIEGTIA